MMYVTLEGDTIIVIQAIQACILLDCFAREDTTFSVGDGIIVKLPVL